MNDARVSAIRDRAVTILTPLGLTGRIHDLRNAVDREGVLRAIDGACRGLDDVADHDRSLRSCGMPPMHLAELRSAQDVLSACAIELRALESARVGLSAAEELAEALDHTVQHWTNTRLP